MIRFLATCAVLFALASDASACRIGRAADPAKTELYSSIYLVEVTGLHLTGYERSKLIDNGSILLPPPAPGLERIRSIVSYTPSFRVNGVVERVVKGPAKHAISAELGGCFVVMPKLKSHGLIFIELATGEALGVWDYRPEAYANALKALGLAAIDEP